MRKLIIIGVAVLLWLGLPSAVRAQEPTYVITVTANTPVELGCVWNESMDLTYLAECTACVQATCTFTETFDTVGVYFGIPEPELLETWSYTATPGTTYTATWYRERMVIWDGYIYTGTHAVTFTISLLEPTPTPTPTPVPTPAPTPTIDPREYSEDYFLSQFPHRVYMPLVMGGGGGGGAVTPGDYLGDTTWWDWAQSIEAFFAPVLQQIGATRTDIQALHDGACGTLWTAFTPPLDPTTAMVELDLLADNPTTTQTAYAMGVSMGRPMAWIRSIQQSNSVFGLNFFVMLIYFLSAGMGWIVFVTIVTYSMRMIRYAIAMIIKLYDLIPFKAT